MFTSYSTFIFIAYY
jgi:20S proteasome subunit beta 1